MRQNQHHAMANSQFCHFGVMTTAIQRRFRIQQVHRNFIRIQIYKMESDDVDVNNISLWQRMSRAVIWKSLHTKFVGPFCRLQPLLLERKLEQATYEWLSSG